LLRNKRGSSISLQPDLECLVTLSRKVYLLVWAAIILCLLPAWQGLAPGSTPDSQGSEVEALIHAGHWKRARAILEPQVKAHPQDPRGCYLLAEVKMSFKDFSGALPLAQCAVDLDGKNSDYHLKLGQVFGEMAARASMFSAGSLALKFRKEVEIAIELDSTNLDALDSMMQFKFQAPGLMGGSKDEARALAEKITHLIASEGYLAHAELAEMEKNPAQVEAYFLKAVQADPKNYGALIALAKFYSQPSHAKYDEATKDAQHALQLDPNQIGAHWILARVLALQGRGEDLEQTLSTSEKDVPDDLRPFYEAAQALLEIGKEFPRAEGYAKKYLSQEPEGEEPEDAEAHRLLGLVFEREGRKSEARAEIQTALQLRSNFKAAKDDLKRLGN
jgi:cytochrome c-type biogenesis protein CcmH/NrfG